MNKNQFMAELEKALSVLPEEEREAALKYYDEYLQDAGVENEEQVIAELGSPREVAQRILDDYKEIDLYNKNGAGEQGENRQKAYGYWHKQRTSYGPGSYGFPKGEKRTGSSAGSAQYAQGESNQAAGTDERNRWIKILLIAVFGLPFFGIAAGLLSGLFGIVAGIFGVLIGYIGACVGIAGFGAAHIVQGCFMLATAPFSGVLYMGVGMLALGLGILMAMSGVVLIKKVIPLTIDGCKRLYNSIFRKRGQAA